MRLTGRVGTIGRHRTEAVPGPARAPERRPPGPPPRRRGPARAGRGPRALGRSRGATPPMPKSSPVLRLELADQPAAKLLRCRPGVGPEGAVRPLGHRAVADLPRCRLPGHELQPPALA